MRPLLNRGQEVKGRGSKVGVKGRGFLNILRYKTAKQPPRKEEKLQA